MLVQTPDMPATVLAERVGWLGSIRWFRENVKHIRSAGARIDPVDRLSWSAEDAARVAGPWSPAAVRSLSVRSTQPRLARSVIGPLAVPRVARPV